LALKRKLPNLSRSKRSVPHVPPALPYVLKHMTLAIRHRMGLSGAEGFRKAYLISRGNLEDLGYLRRGSKSADILRPQLVRLTAAGEQLDRKHKTDVGSKVKNQLFDMLWLHHIEPPETE
jgi:hypothetical protein